MALELDGVDQSADVTISAQTSAQDWFLFSMVRLPTLTQGTNITFWGGHFVGVAYRYIGMRFEDTTDTFESRFRAGTSSAIANNATTRSSATWYRVGARWVESTKTISCYVNSETRVDTVDASHLDNNITKLVLGASLVDGSGTHGDFGNLKAAHPAAWHGTIPSDSDITDLMAGTTKPDGLGTAPDFYETLVSSNGAFSVYGTSTPSADSEDPWGGAASSENSILIFNDNTRNGGMR